MDALISVGLQDELIADLTIELKDEDSFDSSVLTQKIVNAIREVKNIRRYPSYYSDDQIQRDLYKHYSVIRIIALFDYNWRGADGEKSHSENGVSRSYVDRKTLFNGVLPLSN